MKKWLHLFEDPRAAAMAAYQRGLESDLEDYDDTPSESDERGARIEKTIKAFCETELGWDMTRGYSVSYDEGMNLIQIWPNESETSLEALNKLASFGEVMVSAAGGDHSISVDIKTTPGFDIRPSA